MGEIGFHLLQFKATPLEARKHPPNMDAKKHRAQYLLERANSCRGLAKATRDSDVAATLKAMADTYDQQAAELLPPQSMPTTVAAPKRKRLPRLR